MGVAMIPLMIASTVMAAAGSIVQGNQQAAAAKQQAALYEDQARATNQAASAEQDRQWRQSQQALGRQRAAIAQNGGGFSGSNVDAYEQSSANAALDYLNTGYEGQLRAQTMQQQAAVSRTQASNASASGYIGAATSLLSGAASTARAYADFRPTTQ